MGEDKLITIKVCLGGICYVKASPIILMQFKYLIGKFHLEDKVEIMGRFCLGKCYMKREGVCVNIEDMFYHITSDGVEDLFNEKVLARLAELENKQN